MVRGGNLSEGERRVAIMLDGMIENRKRRGKPFVIQDVLDTLERLKEVARTKSRDDIITACDRFERDIMERVPEGPDPRESQEDNS